MHPLYQFPALTCLAHAVNQVVEGRKNLILVNKLISHVKEVPLNDFFECTTI